MMNFIFICNLTRRCIMLKRLMIGLSILTLFSACQSEKSPTNVVNPNPYFTSQQSVKSSSKGCQECGGNVETPTEVDTTEDGYIIETLTGSDKHKAIAEALKSTELRTSRPFITKTFGMRQVVPYSSAYKVQTISGDSSGILTTILIINPKNPELRDGVIMWMNWMGATGALINILERTDQPTDPEANVVHVDPYLYQQLDGGCPAGWEDGAFGEGYTVIGDSISITAMPIDPVKCIFGCLAGAEINAALTCIRWEDIGFPCYLDCYCHYVNIGAAICAGICGVRWIIGILPHA